MSTLPARVPMPRPPRIPADASQQEYFAAERDYARTIRRWLIRDARGCLTKGERASMLRRIAVVLENFKVILTRLSRRLREHRRPPAMLLGRCDGERIRRDLRECQAGPPPKSGTGPPDEGEPRPAAEAAIVFWSGRQPQPYHTQCPLGRPFDTGRVKPRPEGAL